MALNLHWLRLCSGILIAFQITGLQQWGSELRRVCVNIGENLSMALKAIHPHLIITTGQYVKQ